jgi:chromosome segregation ATPase
MNSVLEARRANGAIGLGAGVAAFALTDAIFSGARAARESAKRAEVDRVAASARAARRQKAAAQARVGVLRDVSADLRERLRDAESVIDDLADENRALRAQVAALRERVEELA